MSHQFIQDRLTELLRTAVHCMSNSGYFTRNSANGAVVRVSSKSTCRASLLDTLRKKYIFNDNNCTSDNNKHHVQVWEYESSKEIFAFVRSHFKQPPVWLCSYERPRMMRIVAGCLKQIVQLLNHKHRLHSDFLLLSAYRKDNTFHLVFQNEIFVVWVVGNICWTCENCKSFIVTCSLESPVFYAWSVLMGQTTESAGHQRDKSFHLQKLAAILAHAAPWYVWAKTHGRTVVSINTFVCLRQFSITITAIRTALRRL